MIPLFILQAAVRKPLHRTGIFLAIVAFHFFSPDLEARTFHVGTIGTVPSQEMNKLKPLVPYLEKELSSAGIDRVKIVVAKSISQMATLLQKKGVDLYLDSPYPSMAVSRLAKSRLLLQAGKEGSDRHYSVIFVRKDSGLNHLRQLKGETIAFEEPFSTFGYGLPKMLMREKGYLMRSKQASSDPVAAQEVGYVFSRNDDNTLLWVQKGKVKAGAVDQVRYKGEEKNSPQILKALEKTLPLPPLIAAVRMDIPLSLAQEVQDILIKMDRTEGGKKVLQELQDITRFEPITRKTRDWFIKAAERLDLETR